MSICEGVLEIFQRLRVEEAPNYCVKQSIDGTAFHAVLVYAHLRSIQPLDDDAFR